MALYIESFNEPKSIDYPCLKIQPKTGMIILFISIIEGIILNVGSTGFLPFEKIDNDFFNDLIPYEGKITLENK